MIIEKIEITSTEIPTFRPHKMNIGTTVGQENVIVRVYTDTGIVGYGEAPHMVGHSSKGETPNTVRVVLRDKLVPAVLGRDPCRIESTWQAMERAVPWNYRAKSSINLACYDIMGKSAGTPVYNLLGGKVRDRIPLSWSLPIADFRAIEEEAALMVERGWRILKLKTGRADPMDDAEALRRVRKVVGPKIRLRCDANQAYDARTAIKVLSRMAEWDLEYMEQPCRAGDLDGMRAVRQASTVPIMADESTKCIAELVEVIQRQAADSVSIYICEPGGLLNAKKMAVLAEAHGLQGYVGGALESVIGAAAGLHLAASSPSVSLGCEMGSQFLLTDDIGTAPIPMEEGCLVVPDAPGLGVAVNEDKVKAYQVGSTEVFTL